VAKKHKNAEHWKEAKKTFRLNDDQIAMAKELGMNPRKFGGYASTKGNHGRDPWVSSSRNAMRRDSRRRKESRH
jgi:hypothetical protein